MTKKNKKFIWSGLFLATIGLSLPAFLIPVFSKENDQKKQFNKLKILALNVINANKSSIIKHAQWFYGLAYKRDIEKIKDQKLRKKYISANNLANYITKNKANYDIKVLIGKEKLTDLDEVLFIFRDKKRKKIGYPSSKAFLWQYQKINQRTDEFGLLNTFFKNKVVKTEFQPAVVKKINKRLTGYPLRMVFYDKIELFFLFKNAKPQGSDFSFNLKTDDELFIVEKIKNYIFNLKSQKSQIVMSDLKRKNNLKIDFKKGKGRSGQIIFEFEDYKEIKDINDFRNE